ncbi:perlucin-like protein [Oratosquilla oratoria]|uniref:perlucin-like protein n=1 Tax=Oratosquilla oratoria TaxID=337810 RepID=UPI003F76C008
MSPCPPCTFSVATAVIVIAVGNIITAEEAPPAVVRLQNVKEEASNECSCRSPFYKVGDDCLFVQSDVQHTWDGARKFCREFGGDLVVPSDVLILRKLLTSFRERNFWIGGVDIGDNNNWQWLNGSLVDLSVGWAHNQPDNLPGENCIHYWYNKDWFLNDSLCSNIKNFVCQDAVHPL